MNRPAAVLTASCFFVNSKEVHYLNFEKHTKHQKCERSYANTNL